MLLLVGLGARQSGSDLFAIDDDSAALQRFLREQGINARADTVPGEAGVAFMLQPPGTPSQDRAIEDWVDRGGILVTGAPSMEAVRDAGIAQGAFVDSSSVERTCVVPETVGVDSIAVDPGDRAVSVEEPGAIGCFASGERTFMARARLGDGLVIAGGGPSFLADKLGEPNDAIFVLGLARKGPVVVLVSPPPVAAGGQSFWGTLPPAAKAILVQLSIALVIFAVACGRRFGRPRSEAPLTPIPANELVRARAGLYRRSRSRSHCARIAIEMATSRVAAGLGVSPSEPPGVMAPLVSSATGLSTEEVYRALNTKDPKTNEELASVLKKLEEVVRALEGAR